MPRSKKDEVRVAQRGFPAVPVASGAPQSHLVAPPLRSQCHRSPVSSLTSPVASSPPRADLVTALTGRVPGQPAQLGHVVSSSKSARILGWVLGVGSAGPCLELVTAVTGGLRMEGFLEEEHRRWPGSGAGVWQKELQHRHCPVTQMCCPRAQSLGNKSHPQCHRPTLLSSLSGVRASGAAGGP